MPLAAVAAIGAVGSIGAAAASSAMAPGAPDYQGMYRDGVRANLLALPVQQQINAAAAMGTKATWEDPWNGRQHVSDFTGFGGTDVARAQLLSQLQNADIYARGTLDLQEKYGAQFIEKSLEQWKQSDPEGYALRKAMGEQLTKEGLGYGLTPGLENEVVQSSRAAAAARGNILGVAPAAMEAMSTGDAAFKMHQQRLANATAFINGTTPQSQFSSLNSAANGPVPMYMSPMGQSVTADPNAGFNMAQLGISAYNAQASAYNNSPWTRMLAGVAGNAIEGTMAYGGSYVNKKMGGGSSSFGSGGGGGNGASNALFGYYTGQ